MIVKGIVMEGQKKGREHGFPTANILNTEKLGAGIYAARAFVDGALRPAAVYVGTPRPDILEAHVLDWSGDLYGKMIDVEIVKKIRDDIHETDNEKLRLMIENDTKEIRKCLEV